MSLRQSFLFGGMVAFSLAANPAIANESLVSAGYSNTLGGVAAVSNIHSQNPASVPSKIRQDEDTRLGYLSNIGAYVEVGEFENMDNVVTDLADDIDAANNCPATGSPCASPHLQQRYPNAANNQAAYYSAILNRVNGALLKKLEDNGQIRGGMMVNVPLTPYLFRSKSAAGTFSINMDVSTQFKGRVVTAPFRVETIFTASGLNKKVNIKPQKIIGQLPAINQAINNYQATDDLDKLTDQLLGNQTVTVNGSPQTISLGLTPAEVTTLTQIANNYGNNGTVTAQTRLTTDSGVEFKAASIMRFALDYGTNLTHLLQLDDSNGQLYAGLRFNYYHAKLGRNFVSFTSDGNGDDLFDQASDDFSDYIEADSNIGLDLGVMWQSKNYQVGATMYNVNEPKFDYPDITKHLSDHSLEALKYQAAQGKMDVNESIKLGRHTVVEGAVFTDDRMFSIGAYYTLGKATNFVGDKYQNTGITAGVYTNNWWIPAIRLGYNTNLAGSKLDIVKFGMTLFGVFNLDVAASTDKSSYDGSSIPRYAAVSLGFSEKF